MNNINKQRAYLDMRERSDTYKYRAAGFVAARVHDTLSLDALQKKIDQIEKLLAKQVDQAVLATIQARKSKLEKESLLLGYVFLSKRGIKLSAQDIAKYLGRNDISDSFIMLHNASWIKEFPELNIVIEVSEKSKSKVFFIAGLDTKEEKISCLGLDFLMAEEAQYIKYKGERLRGVHAGIFPYISKTLRQKFKKKHPNGPSISQAVNNILSLNNLQIRLSYSSTLGFKLKKQELFISSVSVGSQEVAETEQKTKKQRVSNKKTIKKVLSAECRKSIQIAEGERNYFFTFSDKRQLVLPLGNGRIFKELLDTDSSVEFSDENIPVKISQLRKRVKEYGIDIVSLHGKKGYYYLTEEVKSISTST